MAVAPSSPLAADVVTGLVLAGGLGRRMGGEDKGFVPLAGRPLVEHVLERLRPQVRTVLINANRNFERYAAYGHPVIADAIGGYLGPLAGVASALPRIATEFMVTVPCDSPLVPADLVERLLRACLAADAEVAVATDGRRQQPVFLLLRRTVAASLDGYLASGGRKIDTWFAAVRLAEAAFDDVPDTFVNVNDPDERQRVEDRLLARSPAP